MRPLPRAWIRLTSIQFLPEREERADVGPRHRASHPLGHPLERGGDHPAGQQAVVRARRSHRKLPVGGHALRHRLRPFLARAVRAAWRRPHLYPGPFGAGHLCARVHRGTALRGTTPAFSAGSERQRSFVLSASLVDAGLVAVPHRVDGARPVDGDLPGAFPQISARARRCRHVQPQGVGLHGRRRDGRAGIARRSVAGGARAAR